MAITWENLDKLSSYKKLQSLKGAVSVKSALSAARTQQPTGSINDASIKERLSGILCVVFFK